MDEVLKQRLVGALVVIALGVLLWPRLFPDPVQPILDRNAQVPPMPSVENLQYPAPEPVTGLDAAGDRYDAAIAQEARAMEKAAQAQAAAAGSATVEPAAIEETGAPPLGAGKPAVDERGIPVAWVLQVVSVSSKSKAESLVEELMAKGLKAYFRPLVRADKTLYQVYVGPRFELQAMRDIKAQVDEELRLKAIIVRYVP